MDPFIVSLVLRDGSYGDEETLVSFETQGLEAVAAIVKRLSKERRMRSGRVYIKVEFGVLVGPSRTVLQMEP